MRSSASRRTLLRGLVAGGMASALRAPLARAADKPPREPSRRHFVFDYYPWFSGGPDFRHWTQWDRRPAEGLSSNYMPTLGAYDSRSASILERHAQWIVESGAGAVALSWWGQGSFEDQCVDLIMDVFHSHGLAVGFGLEPYGDRRGDRFAEDVTYLVRRYGDRRHYDAFCLLADEDGRVGPVFKGFRCIVPKTVVDCHGTAFSVADHTPDDVWRQQIDRLRTTLRGEFDHVRVLADSLDFGRTPASGFDGIAIYDNFVKPERYRPLAEAASTADLLFSFNVNPGYDQIEPREEPVPPPEGGATDCYVQPSVDPVGARVDWSKAEERERAAAASEARIRGSFDATLAVQTDRTLNNARQGFFLVYLNSFNEWHEGHAFEPMRDSGALLPAERSFGYHNPSRGDYRLRTLAELIEQTVGARHPVTIVANDQEAAGYAGPTTRWTADRAPSGTSPWRSQLA